MTLAARLFASVGGIALLLLAGNGLLRFFPAFRARPRAVRLAYAWLLGAGAVPAALFALSHVFHVLLSPAPVYIVVVLLSACALIPGRAKTLPPKKRLQARSTRVAMIAAVLIGSCVTAGLFAESVSEGIRDWDGQMSWTAAARWIRADRSVDTPVLREDRWFVSHPQYPVLLPVMQVAVQEALGATDDTRVIRPLYATFFPAFLLVLFDAASRRAGRRAAALGVAAVALVPFCAFDVWGGGAGTTYSDFPLAAFWGAGLLLLLERDVLPSTGAAAGILLGAAALSKNEGGPLALVALAVAAFAALLLARREKSPALRALLPVALATAFVAAALALFFFWRSGIVNRYDEKYDERFRQLPVIQETVKRLPLLPDPMWKEMTDPEVWDGFWWSAPVILLGGAGAFRRRPARPLVAAIGGSIAVFLVAYGLTPWNAAELVHPTWNRFLLQLSLPFFVVLAMALRDATRAARGLRTIAPVNSGSPEAGARPAQEPFVREALLFLAFLALTVAVTWPWARHLRDTCPDAGDPYLNSWIMWWDWWATFHQPFRLFDGNIFFPLKYSLAFSEHNYGIALLFFPAYALGIRPLTVQGVATLLGFAFSGYGAFRLTRTLTGSTGAGVVAGIAFAFTPYRYHQLSHVNYLFSGWIPIVLEALVLFVRKRTPKRAAWLGVAFLMNGLSVIHWLVLTLVPLAAVGIVLAVRQRAERDPDLWKRGALALGAAGLALLPFLIPYQKASKLYGMVRNADETLAYSALPKHWLTSSPTNRLWGWLGSPAEGELALFPGLLMLLLPLAAYFLVDSAPAAAAGGATRPPSRRRLAILDAAALASGTLALFVSFWPIHLHLFGRQVLRATDPGRAFAVLFVALAIRWCLAWPKAFRFSGASLPDSLRGLRRDDAFVVGLLLAGIGFLGSFGLRLPFHRVLYETVFLFRSIRAPARWAMVAHLGLALLAGLGVLRIAERLAARKPGRPVAAAVFGAAALAMLFELYAPLKTVVMRGEADPDEATLFLKETPMKGGIVELPVSDAAHGNYRYVLRAADHMKPLVNGVSGFGVPHVTKLEELLQKKPVSPELLDLLESIPVSYVVVHSSWYPKEDLAVLREFLSEAMKSERLRFVGRFGPARDDIFAVSKTEPAARATRAPLWKLNILRDLAVHGREDEFLIGSIDDPGEGAAVTGELLVRGWARRPDEDLAVTVLIDGEVSEPASFKRVDRPDVCSVLPKMKRCETAGYEARIPFTPGAAGRHELTVLFRSSDGRYRFYPARRFTWKPPAR